MTPAPPCRAVGPQCLALAVTIRVAESETADIRSIDHEATWLLGHTERIDFGPVERRGRALVAPSVLRVPCRFANMGPDGDVGCRAHGFEGRVRERRRPAQPRQLGSERFAVVQNGRVRILNLARQTPPRRALAVLPAPAPNPCATARCRTADNAVGAACCRDLQVEILCGPSQRRLEALIRTRKSPYLCKVSRERPDALGVEMISACAFLDREGSGCTLHGRTRPDGRTAKPDLCFTWPEPGDVYHPQCAFGPA